MHRSLLPLLLSLLFLTSLSASADSTSPLVNTRGVNLGNALEAPKEGQWGYIIKAGDFDNIKSAGFTNVRIPVSWAYYSDPKPPHTIDPKFFARIDEIVDAALARGLVVILNDHHENNLYKDPAAHHDRFIAQWKQIAERYRERSPKLLFELLNEPHDNLGDEAWNKLLADTLPVVRASNPTRSIIISPANWGSFEKLKALRLPSDDHNLIVTFHYYSPFRFTHQGAEWAGPQTQKWLGTKWTGTDGEKAEVDKHFAAAARWSAENNRPLYLGEFGAFSKADMESRARWTDFIARTAEKHNIPWSYWEYCSGFGVYDPKAKVFRPELLHALIPEK